MRRCVQAVEVVEAHEKDGKLLGLLAKHHKSRANRILVFVLYKKEAARVEALLQRKGWKVSPEPSQYVMNRVAVCVQYTIGAGRTQTNLQPAGWQLLRTAVPGLWSS